MEEFILEGEPFKFSYEGVDYTCEVMYLDSYNGLRYYRIDLAEQKIFKIFRWNYKYLVERYSLTCWTKDELPFTLINGKKYFSPELIKEAILTRFKEEEAEIQAKKLLNERVKNIKIVKEL